MKRRGQYFLRALFMAATLVFIISACGGGGGGAPDPTGKLEITVSGLAGVDGDITVTGPDSYNAEVTKTTELADLTPGTYEITAQPVAGHVVRETMPITAAVEAGKTATATVTYEFIGVDINISAPEIMSLNEAATVTMNIERFGSFAGEVRLTHTAPGTFDCFVLGSSCAAEQVVPANGDSISYSFTDDGTTPIGAYEFRVNTEHELDGETIAHEFVFDIDVAPVVTTVDDATPAEPGMLRFLVADARTEHETITFLPSVFSDATEIMLTDEIAIEQPLTIDGPLDENDDPLVVLDGGHTVNVLRITADAAVRNLGVQHGVRDLGAGVFVGPSANVTLENTRITNNTATETGGGVHNTGTLRTVKSIIGGNSAASLGMPNGMGGGVYSVSDLTIIDSDIVSNTAKEYGGGIAMMPGGVLEITGALIADNTALVQSGGGLYIGTDTGSSPIEATLDTTFIKQNTAPSGGGIMSFGDVKFNASEITDNEASLGDGGGISNHYKMKITESFVALNNAASGGGGLFNDGYIEISQSTISKNGATEGGGGIYNGVIDSDRHADGFTKYATIGTSIIRDNHTDGSGGGIYSVRRLDIVNTQVENNVADVDGGGIYTVSVPHTATNNNGGQFSFAASTVANNLALGRGGGIYAGTEFAGDSQAIPGGEFIIRNALVYGNNADGSGGGIQLSGKNVKDATIFFTTIMDNTTRSGAAGLHIVDRGDGSVVGIRYRGNLFLDNEVQGSATDFSKTSSTPSYSEGYNSFTNANSTVGHSDATGDRLRGRSEVVPEPYGNYGSTAIGRDKEAMSSVKITPASAVAIQCQSRSA